VAIIDFVIVNVFIIPAEEKELLERYGIEYIRYKKEVPYRFLPFIF
jgi:protein-S-isoprenylcysteine O-methyltransferase Ste14